MVSSLALASIAVKGLKAFRVVVFTRADFVLRIVVLMLHLGSTVVKIYGYKLLHTFAVFIGYFRCLTRFGSRVKMKVVCCFYLFFFSSFYFLFFTWLNCFTECLPLVTVSNIVLYLQLFKFGTVFILLNFFTDGWVTSVAVSHMSYIYTLNLDIHILVNVHNTPS